MDVCELQVVNEVWAKASTFCMWRKGFSPLVPGLARRPTDQILEVSLFVARGQIGLKRLDTGCIIFHKAD